MTQADHPAGQAGPVAGLRIPRLIGLQSEDDPNERWQRTRADILRKISVAIGPLPPPVPPEPKIVFTEELDDGNLIRQSIRYRSFDDDEVSAYLLYPSHVATEAHGACPAMIALHQTVPQGKEAVAGLQGDPDDRYGLELAGRGYAVLVPDVLTAGDRIYPGFPPYCTRPFEEKYPHWSMIGKMIYDHRQGLELLAGLEWVDKRRIGAIGHSLGAYNAYFLAAFDERVRAVVASCGFYPFAGDSYPLRWGRREFTHIPELNRWLERGEVPFEFHEVAAAIAPRAYFNWSAQSDEHYGNWQSIGTAMLALQEVYEALGVPDRFVSIIAPGGHRFSPFARACAYQWLDCQLKGVDSFSDSRGLKRLKQTKNGG